MKRSGIISFLLVAAMLFSAFVMPFNVSAAIDLSGYNLNTVQKYFLRLVGSLARADYYENDILASVTLSQAIYESGWGRYSLPVGGNNLFGIKAFSTWDGKVYDLSTSILYSSYADFVFSAGQGHLNTVSAWRAYDSWAESVDAHSSLFVEESNYAAVVGEKDYAKAAKAIVDAGYSGDTGYASTVISLIEQYRLTEYDDITPDSDGVVAVVMNPERKLLDIGESYTVPLTFYPADKTASSVTWASDNPSVATVDQNGTVTAVSHGMTLITATLANGREACCIVYVDCNATAIDKDAEVYQSPSANADTNGKIYRGSALKVTDDTVYIDSEGNKFYKVTGYGSKGTVISGYALTEYVFRNKCNVSSIATVKDNLTLKVGDVYTVATAVAPANAADAELNWMSGDETVATVNKNGVITAKALGTTVIKAITSGGAQTSIEVTVAPYYREYKGIATSYETLVVRSGPSADASRVGKLSFLSEVTVIGEPVGVWYKVSGTDSDGDTVSGYANSAYIRLIDDGFTVKYGSAPSNVTVYAECDIYSMSYSNLAQGTDYAIIGEAADGWSYVVGLKNPSDLKAVYGYARLNAGGGNNGGTSAPAGSYYGRTVSELNVRSGAGTGYDAVGRFAKGAQIIITGEAENGWYKVSGTGIDGSEISGYSSANYIILLYSGTIAATQLNVRESPSTDANIVGQLANGTEVVIIGEAENNWYNIESADGSISGYCSADYISNNGLLYTVPPADDRFSIIDNNIVIQDRILTGVDFTTTVSELLACFTGTVSVVNASGDILSESDYVGTGCRIRVTEDGITYDAATVRIMGDVDGDGELRNYDYILIKRHFMGTYTLAGVYLEAAHLSGRENINIVDYILIKRAYFGTYKIEQ